MSGRTLRSLLLAAAGAAAAYLVLRAVRAGGEDEGPGGNGRPPDPVEPPPPVQRGPAPLSAKSPARRPRALSRRHRAGPRVKAPLNKTA